MAFCEPHSPKTHLAVRITVLATSFVVFGCLIVGLSVPYTYTSNDVAESFFYVWILGIQDRYSKYFYTNSRDPDYVPFGELAAFSMEVIGCVSACMCVALSAVLVGIQARRNKKRPCCLFSEHGFAISLLVCCAVTFSCCLMAFCFLVTSLSTPIKGGYVGLWILLAATVVAVPGVVLMSLESMYGVTYCFEGCCDDAYWNPCRSPHPDLRLQAGQPASPGYSTPSCNDDPNATPTAPGYRFKALNDLHRYTP